MEKVLYIELYRYALKPQFECNLFDRRLVLKCISFLKYDLFQQAFHDYQESYIILKNRTGEYFSESNIKKKIDDPILKKRKQELNNFLLSSEKFLITSLHTGLTEEQFFRTESTLKQVQEFIHYRYLTSKLNGEYFCEIPRDYFRWWLRKSYKERKQAIKKFFPQKKNAEVNAVLRRMNDYLNELAQLSFDRSWSLYEYVSFGKSFDWLFHLFTETNLTDEEDFVRLFSECLREEHDLISLTGELEILKERKALEFLLDGELPHAEQYLSDFEEVLKSAIRIGRLIEKTQLAKIKLERTEKEALIKKVAKNEQKEKIEKLNQIESYHKIGVDYRKIHEIQDFE